MKIEHDELLTVAEVAPRVKLSEDRVRTLIREARFRALGLVRPGPATPWASSRTARSTKPTRSADFGHLDPRGTPLRRLGRRFPPRAALSAHRAARRRAPAAAAGTLRTAPRTAQPTAAGRPALNRAWVRNGGRLRPRPRPARPPCGAPRARPALLPLPRRPCPPSPRT